MSNGHRALALFIGITALFSCSLSPLAQSYPGDCNGDWSVTIGEVQKGVNMFLGSELPSCSVDADGDSKVSIGELQRVINCFLGYCPKAAIVGLDTDGDGVADLKDADGDGTLDGEVASECLAPPIGLRLLAAYAGASPSFSGRDLPSGMVLERDGGIAYQPSCADAGSLLSPKFFLNGESGVTVLFKVTETHAPEIVGLDTGGDGAADVADADGNGVLDAELAVECTSATPYIYYLVARYAGKDPVFTAEGLPSGMRLQPGGAIIYQPSCADAGAAIAPKFFVNGSQPGMTARFLVKETREPVIVGIDGDGDGVAENIDANGDGLLDSPLQADCSFPLPFAARLIAMYTGQNPVFQGAGMPSGMTLASDGSITYAPPCGDLNRSFRPSFSVDGGGGVSADFKVVKLPRLAVDTDGDGVQDIEDLDKDGVFDSGVTLPCGAPTQASIDLVAINAGDNPSFLSTGLEPWMALQGCRLDLLPPCGGVEGHVYEPKFAMAGSAELATSPVALPLPVYGGWYDFPATSPWFVCPSAEFPKEAVVVTAFDRAYHYFGPEDRRTIVKEAEFPTSGTWSQVGLLLRLECPESGLCDYWDRLGSIQMVTNPSEPQDKWQYLEITRHVTPYRIGMCEYIDLTPIAHLLRGCQTFSSFIDTWVGPGNSSGEGWRLTAQFIMYPGPDRGADEVLNIWGRRDITVGFIEDGRDVDSQTPPFQVSIPAWAMRVEARLITTGHSFENTLNCAEFCSMRQDLYVNGSLKSVNPWRPDCDKNPFSPQYGTWKYARNGWCPGSIVAGNIIDITDKVRPGAENTLDFDIRLADGTEYNNTRPNSWAPFEAVSLQLLIYK